MYSKQFLDEWYADELKKLIYILRKYKAVSNSQKSALKPYLRRILSKINYIRELQGQKPLCISRIHMGDTVVYIVFT